MNEPRWTDEEIYAAMAADPDFPEVTDADLRNAVAVDHLGNVRPLRHRSPPTDECFAMEAPEVRKHEGGLRVQAMTGPDMRTHVSHTVELPRCCPVSGNPQPGSTLRLSYLPSGWVVEVYSLPQVIQRFVGGWGGSVHYPPERNMEGMIRTLTQMAADALHVAVSAHAHLVLDAGREVLRVRAEPRVPAESAHEYGFRDGEKILTGETEKERQAIGKAMLGFGPSVLVRRWDGSLIRVDTAGEHEL